MGQRQALATLRLPSAALASGMHAAASLELGREAERSGVWRACCNHAVVVKWTVPGWPGL